ncbi:MAG: hypothetical protein K2M95_04870, partial [Clostridiales bacterium]|nr:hypothetical protein [Clostridiales bacterium]
LADTATQETLRARTWAATEKADATANAWLSYSFVESNTKISIQATRYWTGTKAFYVRIKNAHGLPSWFKFYAKVEGGELKKDATLPTAMLDDFKFGKSTTQVPTEKMKRETSPLRSTPLRYGRGDRSAKTVDSIAHGLSPPLRHSEGNG